MDSGKKISFSFTKSNKKPAVIRNKPVEHKKVDLVECLEEQFIKIKGAVEVLNEPLVIPIKDNKKNLFDRVRETKTIEKELIKDNLKQEDDNRPDSDLTIEELAARELINDAKIHLSNKVSTKKIFVLPITEDKITLDGEEEPTLDDYENVPISDYGMAMLRGMGWKEGMGIGKNQTKSAATSEPELRPKGLGLGANKMVKAELSNKTACDKDGNALILKRGTYAKIIAGAHKGNYCEVQGLDDEAGRIIVRTSLNAEILTLNEFLIVPVTKEDFSKGSKILNNAKYEEYKEISDKKLDSYQRAKRGTKVENSREEPVKRPSSTRKFKERQESHDDEERLTRSSDYDDEYLTSKQENGRNSRKSHMDERKNEKVDRYSHKDKHKNRSRSSHRDKKRASSDSDSNNEKKNRKDTDRKKYHHGESSRSHEAKYKSGKKSSKSKYRSRSSSSDDEREMNKKSKSKSKTRRDDDFEREKNYRKNRR